MGYVQDRGHTEPSLHGEVFERPTVAGRRYALELSAAWFLDLSATSGGTLCQGIEISVWSRACTLSRPLARVENVRTTLRRLIFKHPLIGPVRQLAVRDSPCGICHRRWRSLWGRWTVGDSSTPSAVQGIGNLGPTRVTLSVCQASETGHLDTAFGGSAHVSDQRFYRLPVRREVPLVQFQFMLKYDTCNAEERHSGLGTLCASIGPPLFQAISVHFDTEALHGGHFSRFGTVIGAMDHFDYASVMLWT